MRWKVLGMITSCADCPHLNDLGVVDSKETRVSGVVRVFSCTRLATRGQTHVISVPIGPDVPADPAGRVQLFDFPEHCPLETEYPRT